MNLDLRRIYIHAVLGSLGALTGWALAIPVAWLALTDLTGLLLRDVMLIGSSRPALTVLRR
jgi:hypothetical protein